MQFIQRNNHQQGLTLIEMVITVLIISILAAIAYPSYVNHVAKSSRAEGLSALTKVMNLQEQYYLDHRQFTTDMKQLGLNASPYITENGFYSISTAIDSGTGEYTITATATNIQATRDASCSPLTIDAAGTKNKPECW